MRETSLQIKPTKVNGETYWQLTIPKAGGGRVRKTFKDKRDAEIAFKDAKFQLRSHGVEAAAMSDLLRSQAVEADRILQPYSVTILDVARNYVAIRQAADKSRSIEEAVKDFIADKTRTGRSKVYLKDLRTRLGKLSDEFGSFKASEVTTTQLADWLHEVEEDPVSRNTVQARVNTLFNFCASRDWCARNPVSKISRSKESDKPIGILTPEQFAKLLEVSAEDTLPYHLIGGFAGLRSAELERLEWKDVHFESGLVEVVAAKSKTAQRRLATILPCLAQWLAPFRGRTGKVSPPNLLNKIRADRKRAGVTTWPDNALRHSYASYHLAHFGDAGKLAGQMGHGNSSLIYRNYRELVRPETAKLWWSIVPQSPGNVVGMAS
jgi:integrase